MIKLCMFDLDGTLADTIEDLANAMNYALNKNGFLSHEVEAYKIFVGDGIIKLAQRASASDDINVHKKIVASFDEYYSAHLTDKTKPYDGCVQMLEKLNEQGIRCGVLSNKPHKYVERILSKLYPNFSFVCKLGKQEDFEPKPNPTALIQELEKLNIGKDECLYIGDSDVDIRTAKNAGVHSCGVTWGFRSREELEFEGAENVVDNPMEICKLCVEYN